MVLLSTGNGPPPSALLVNSLVSSTDRETHARTNGGWTARPGNPARPTRPGAAVLELYSETPGRPSDWRMLPLADACFVPRPREKLLPSGSVVVVSKQANGIIGSLLCRSFCLRGFHSRERIDSEFQDLAYEDNPRQASGQADRQTPRKSADRRRGRLRV